MSNIESMGGPKCERKLTVDQIRTMMFQESTRYAFSVNYYKGGDASGKNQEEESTAVYERWRYQVVMWCFEVIDHLSYDRDLVSIGMNYLDRFVATTAQSETLTRREFQLASITCLYIAMKLHGETDDVFWTMKKMDIGFFVHLCKGNFQVDDYRGMERRILKALTWRMSPPTVCQFLVHFLNLFPENEVICHDSQAFASLAEMSRYLAELSVCNSSFLRFHPSIVAFASIVSSLEALQDLVDLETRSEFLNTIANVAFISPQLKSVTHACTMLKDVCTSMKNRYYREAKNESLDCSTSTNRNTSPVRVCDDTQVE